MAEKRRRIRRICASPFIFFPFFSGFSLFLSLSPVSRTPPTYDHMTPFSRATLVPSALKRSIEAVYRILQKKTLPLATRRVEKELLPIKKARTRFFFFFERPRGVNAFYGPRIQWLPPTIPPCTCNNALSMENSRESPPPPPPHLSSSLSCFKGNSAFRAFTRVPSHPSFPFLIFTRRAKELCFRPTPFPHCSFVNDRLIRAGCIESPAFSR